MRITEFLSKDHDRLDSIYKEFESFSGRDPDKARRLFLKFRRDLERHIAWEERLLFPPFERATGMGEGGPTAVMRIEHAQIKALLARMDQGLDGPAQALAECSGWLAQTLADHNAKEEQILYPWLDDALSPAELRRVIEEMSAEAV